MEIFLDDFCGDSLERNHLDFLQQCLMKCRAYSMSLNPKKCIFAVPYGLLLGYVVSSKGLMPDVNKVSKILQLNPPTMVTELQSFLGHVGFYKRFICHYADKVALMTRLLEK